MIPQTVFVPTEVSSGSCCRELGAAAIGASLLAAAGGITGALYARQIVGGDALIALGLAALIAAPFELLLTLLAAARYAGREDARRRIALVALLVPLALVPVAWGLLLVANSALDDSPARLLEAPIVRTWHKSEGGWRAEVTRPDTGTTRRVRLPRDLDTSSGRLVLTFQDGALGWERMTGVAAGREP